MFELMMLACFLGCSLVGLLPCHKTPRAKQLDIRTVAKQSANVRPRSALSTRQRGSQTKRCGAHKAYKVEICAPGGPARNGLSCL